MRFTTILDITRPLTPADPPFPGDPPLALHAVTSHAEHGVQTTALSLCAHSGTHLDLPGHLFPAGATLEALAAERFLLPARVLDARATAHVDAGLVERAGLAPGMAALFCTRNSSRRVDPAGEFSALTPAAATALVRAGCALAGVDGPSVDPPDSEDLPVHRTLLGANVLILENLDLARAEPGDWTLACFPLLLPGVEASPVRAVLLR